LIIAVDLFKFSDDIGGLKIQGTYNLKELYNIKTTFPALVFRDVGLWPLQSRGQFLLCETRGNPRIDQELA
jgi:hypothetical protein